MISEYERMQELRAADPHGRRSDSDLERQVDKEVLGELIENLPDIDERACDLKDILRRLLALVSS